MIWTVWEGFKHCNLFCLDKHCNLVLQCFSNEEPKILSFFFSSPNIRFKFWVYLGLDPKRPVHWVAYFRKGSCGFPLVWIGWFHLRKGVLFCMASVWDSHGRKYPCLGKGLMLRACLFSRERRRVGKQFQIKGRSYFTVFRLLVPSLLWPFTIKVERSGYGSSFLGLNDNQVLIPNTSFQTNICHIL